MENGMKKPIVKFLIVSDTHFGIHYANNPRSKLRFALGNQFFDQAEILFKLAIEKHDVDFIVHCGDFFNRSKPSSSTIARATSLLLWAARYVPIYIVPGNHERGKLPIGLLHYQKNLHIFTKPCSFFFRKNDVVVKISGVPYIRHNIRQEYLSLVEKAWRTEIDSNNTKSTYNILVLHQLIQGSRVEHYTFRRGDNVINFDEIQSKFHLIAVGHVHRFQFLHKSNGRINSSHTTKMVNQDIKKNIWTFVKGYRRINNQNPVICYPGSCERISMMERNENKGYIIGCINHNDSKAYLEFHPVNSIPMMMIKWDNPNDRSSENLIHQTYTKIQRLSSVSSLKHLGGVLKITSSKVIDPNSISRLREVAEQEKVILKISNYRL
jgi:DNA repair exonuclease SbcCD nuclease subunit